MLLWRTGAAGGREGLLCRASASAGRDYARPEITLDIFEVNDRLLEVEIGEKGTLLWLHSSSLPVGARAPERRLRLDVDPQSGELSSRDPHPDEELLSWFRQELDGELLAHLRRTWLVQRGSPARRGSVLSTPRSRGRSWRSGGV